MEVSLLTGPWPRGRQGGEDLTGQQAQRRLRSCESWSWCRRGDVRKLRAHSLGLAGSRWLWLLGGLTLSTSLAFQSQLVNPND